MKVGVFLARMQPLHNAPEDVVNFLTDASFEATGSKKRIKSKGE